MYMASWSTVLMSNYRNLEVNRAHIVKKKRGRDPDHQRLTIENQEAGLPYHNLKGIEVLIN